MGLGSIARTLNHFHPPICLLHFEGVRMSLNIQGLTVFIGKREILSDETVGIADGAKVGLIGRNGAGKTTLLKAILGQIDYTGKIDFTGKVAYFAQHIDVHPHQTVREAIEEGAVTSHHSSIDEEIQQIEQQLGDPAVYSDAAKMTKLSERYAELQTLQAKSPTQSRGNSIQSILRTLEVDESWLDQEVKTLSTGQRAIVALARILSSDADLLLLDEPTNHLDFKRLDVLEEYIRKFKGTVIVVTHDRYFLDHVCDTIIKIEKGNWIKYNGNYSDYKKARDFNFKAQQIAYANEQEYLAIEKDKIARIGKSPQKVKQGQYREKLLEKRELIEKPDLDKTNFETRFEASPIRSSTVMHLVDLSIGRDQPLLQHINLNVGSHHRVILIGENGIGKSTLMKTIEGRLEPLAGKVVLDIETRLAYADQELKDLSTDKTLYEEIFAMLKDQAKTRQNLSMVGFINEDDVFKQISTLSMGEKSRLNLLKLLLQKPNLLLLDEPTNHLDIDAREIIENAFLNYDGAIFAISHDRYFIKKIADRVLKAQDGTIKELVKTN